MNANSERSGVRHKPLQVAAGATLVNKRSIGTAFALLLLASWPTLAWAGLTISDRRYWPSEARGGYDEIPMLGLASEPKIMPF